MQTAAESNAMLALLGWPEILGVLIIILVLVGVRRLPDVWKGIDWGLKEFDDAASEAGRSVGGIYGKPAVQALTPDNETAELYEPAAWQENGQSPKARLLLRFWRRLWRFLARAVGKQRD